MADETTPPKDLEVRLTELENAVKALTPSRRSRRQGAHAVKALTPSRRSRRQGAHAVKALTQSFQPAAGTQASPAFICTACQQCVSCVHCVNCFHCLTCFHCFTCRPICAECNGCQPM